MGGVANMLQKGRLPRMRGCFRKGKRCNMSKIFNLVKFKVFKLFYSIQLISLSFQMQLFAAILATLWIFVPPSPVQGDIKSALKKTFANSLVKKTFAPALIKKPFFTLPKKPYFSLLKKNFVNSTRPKQPTDKRWMRSNKYMKTQPVQRYTVNYNTDLIDGQQEQPEQQSNDLVDGSMAPYDREEQHEEQSFQGLKELKLPKAGGLPSENNPQQSDQALMFASDIAQYLKPGIGDDPSDMPGGLKSYGGSLNGVGLPITGKLRSTKLTPVASFGEQREEDLSHKLLLSPSTAVIPEIISDSMRTDSASAAKLLDEMPGKISEVSASLADASKSFTGAGESPMIVSAVNNDASPSSVSTPDSSVASQSDAIDTDNSAASTSSETSSEKSSSKEEKGGKEKASEGITNDSDEAKEIKEKKLAGKLIKGETTSVKPGPL